MVSVLVTLYETTDKPSDALEYPSVDTDTVISENVKDSYTILKHLYCLAECKQLCVSAAVSTREGLHVGAQNREGVYLEA